MKILITGAAGYIGSVLTPELLKLGHKVCVVDNFMYNQTPLLPYCYSDNLTIKRMDVTSDAFIKYVYENDFDALIPLACLTGAPLCEFRPDEAESVIVTSTMDILASIEDKVKIIYPNTNSGYGIGEESHCTEDSPLKPISRYGQLKCEAEEKIMRRGNAVGFRLATVFGLSPRMRLDLLVNDFVYRAVNDGYIALFEAHARRNYIHVMDVCRAFIHALRNWGSMDGNIYNVGLSSANLTKKELALKIKEHIPDIEIFEGQFKKDKDKRDYLVSNEKLEATGWKPVWDLDSGIKELIKGYEIIKRNQYSNI